MPVVLALALLPALPAAAAGFTLADWLRTDSGWKDFGEGTMTHVRKTSTMDIPGMPAGRKVVFEEKRTLTAKSDTTATVRVERKVAGRRWEQRDITEPLIGRVVGKAGVVRDAKQQPVTTVLRIEGKDYTCTQYSLRRTVGDVTERAEVYVHDTLGVLHYEGGRGQGSRMRWTVIRLGVTRTIGDVTVVGRQLAVKSKDTTGTMIVSPDVPGFVVEEVLQIQSGATRSTSKRELIGFVKR